MNIQPEEVESRHKFVVIITLLAIAWLLLIASLLYDPISPLLTHPDTHWSLLRFDPRVFDPKECYEVVTVQGQCLVQQPVFLNR